MPRKKKVAVAATPTTDTKKKTHCILVLDSSGSMIDAAASAVMGYNEHVEQFQIEAKDPNLEVDVSLVTFNGQVWEHLWCVPADQLEKASLESFNPKGATALYDGMGYVIDKFNNAEDANDPNVAYLMVVITDGGENDSKHYGNENNPSIIAELISGCEKSNRWTISFLGCSKDELLKIRKATGDNISLGNMAAWSNTARGTQRAMKQNTNATRGYFESRKKGMTKVNTLYSANSCVLADYSDDAADVVAQDLALGIDANTVPVSSSIGPGQAWASNSSVAANNFCQTGSVSHLHVEGTADVFAKNKLAMDRNYQRSSK